MNVTFEDRTSNWTFSHKPIYEMYHPVEPFTNNWKYYKTGYNCVVGRESRMSFYLLDSILFYASVNEKEQLTDWEIKGDFRNGFTCVLHIRYQIEDNFEAI